MPALMDAAPVDLIIEWMAAYELISGQDTPQAETPPAKPSKPSPAAIYDALKARLS